MNAEQQAAAISQAYGSRVPMDFARAIVATAGRLGAHAFDLANEINFESGFNPQAKNPLSSATGLIQFISSTAQRLGTTTDALSQMTAIEQMHYVEKYLAPFAGRLNTPHGLAMAVFYPKALTWSPTQPFPSHVQRVNPGITTPADYVALVLRRAKLPRSDEQSQLLATAKAPSFVLALLDLKHQILTLPPLQMGLVLAAGSIALAFLVLSVSRRLRSRATAASLSL